MSEFLEICMIVAFGFSWPNNIITSLKSKSTKGKSLAFMLLINFGYICGITNKILYSNDIVLYLYILNFIMVSIDTCLFYRNCRLDREREQAAGEAK